MAEPTQGMPETSIVIDHDLIGASLLPDGTTITAITLAELAAASARLHDGVFGAARATG